MISTRKADDIALYSSSCRFVSSNHAMSSQVAFLPQLFIARWNDLFIDYSLTETDMINYANTIMGKVSEEEVTMEHV